MTSEQLVQLKAMSYDERVAKYKPLRNAGRVSLKEYAYIIYSIPYSQALEESSEMGGDIRESADTNELHAHGQTDRHDSECGERHQETDKVAHGEQAIAPMAFVDSLLVRERANDAMPQLDAGRTDTDKTGSQKQRLLSLLSDGEWYDTPSIQYAVYGGEHLGVARIAARIGDLKKDGHDIESKKVSKSIWCYRLVKKDGFAETIKNIASG